MEKNITLQQSDIRVINAKQVQTSALLDGMKKPQPLRWSGCGSIIRACSSAR